jgi:hypothetical protein
VKGSEEINAADSRRRSSCTPPLHDPEHRLPLRLRLDAAGGPEVSAAHGVRGLLFGTRIRRALVERHADVDSELLWIWIARSGESAISEPSRCERKRTPSSEIVRRCARLIT